MPLDTSKLPATPTLQDLLRLSNYHGGVFDDEQYKARGQAMLDAVRKYDPTASWVDHQSGGEGGSNHDGFQLQYDYSKLPKNAYGNPGTFGVMPYLNKDYGNLFNPADIKDDINYGKIVNSKNLIKGGDPAWTKYAPLLVAALATAGTALGAAPAMAGVAGGTAGVTGGAAGLAAGNIAGTAATGAFGGAISSGVKALPNTAMSLMNHQFNPLGLASTAAGFIPGMENMGQYIKYAQMANQAYSITRGRN